LNNKIGLGSGDNTVVAGTGSDSVIVNGGHDSLIFAGSSNQANLMGATESKVVDHGTGLQIDIWSSRQTDTIFGFGADGHGLVAFVNGAGSFTSVQAILDGLHSDHHGGTMLSLGKHGAIDFVDTSRLQLTAANFTLLAQYAAAAPSLSGAGPSSSS
jgi:hypothetical protein